MDINKIKAICPPILFLIIIPAILLFDFSIMNFKFDFYLPFVGGIFLCAGLIIMGMAARMMFLKNKEAPALRNEPASLITSGLYGYIRNPMVAGSLLILLGEAAIFGSSAILLWLFIFFIINDFYFYFVEEPDLEKKFGQDYKKYKESVPKWLPKIKL
ncbi:MAG: isoprenylcysteine carboxylmethyltransferase family protein [Candidatus Pacebacteria bacterium]|nr:isoprenylcysteine carboxylmethyltransferase family protein [Candidatus Paceibacterota bacterium]